MSLVIRTLYTEDHEEEKNPHPDGTDPHSSAFALANKESRYEKLILYASYTDEKHTLRDKPLRVLSISGTNDGLATLEKIEKGKTLLPPDTEFLQIEGGNHTQFALYGGGKLQKGDKVATLPAIKQQQMIIDATVDFLLPNPTDASMGKIPTVACPY